MTKPFLALMGLLLVTVACDDNDSPTAPTTQTPTPTPPAAPAPTPPAPPAPTPTAVLTITPSTLQVPWSRTPATGFADCTAAGRSNLWQWEVTITETAGVPVTLTRAVMLADGQVLTDGTISQSIAARGSVTRQPFQCWTSSSGHTAQVTYSGTDANNRAVSVTSPVITLVRRP